MLDSWQEPKSTRSCSPLAQSPAWFWKSIGSGCGIGCRCALDCGKRSFGKHKVGRLQIKDFLTVEEDTRGDHGGDERHVVRALSIEEATPPVVAELGESAAE